MELGDQISELQQTSPAECYRGPTDTGMLQWPLFVFVLMLTEMSCYLLVVRFVLGT